MALIAVREEELVAQTSGCWPGSVHIFPQCWHTELLTATLRVPVCSGEDKSLYKVYTGQHRGANVEISASDRPGAVVRTHLRSDGCSEVIWISRLHDWEIITDHVGMDFYSVSRKTKGGGVNKQQVTYTYGLNVYWLSCTFRESPFLRWVHLTLLDRESLNCRSFLSYKRYFLVSVLERGMKRVLLRHFQNGGKNSHVAPSFNFVK